GHDHALAGGEAIGLDDNGCAHLIDVGQGLVDVGEVAIGSGRDFMPGEKILGEGLRAFQLRRALARTEAGQLALGEVVANAGYQRRFRADDGQRHAFRLGKVRQRGKVHHIDGHILDPVVDRRARIARRYKDLIHTRTLRALPRNGVLTPTTTYHQNFHRVDLTQKTCPNSKTSENPCLTSHVSRLTSHVSRLTSRSDQCLKCRIPVNTIAMPCSSAAAITSSSRTEPPGWITAVAPASTAARRPSANGKKASDATTEPMVRGSPRPAASIASSDLRAAMCEESTRLI